jgi:ATP-dependent RNA helicase DeaD
MNFTEMQIPSPLRAEIIARGYTTPTKVQETIASPEYASGDLLVSSKTGSGKTIGFGLAFAPQLLGDSEKLKPTQTPRALIVAPTRELAQQVAEELSWLYRSAGGRVATCVGGIDIRRELKQLSLGAHIVVGTPGRLNDHINRGSLKLETTEVVVLDEADEMLDMGFREELEFILDAAKARSRTLLFSATIPTEIQRLAQRYTKDAKRVAIDAGEAHEDIEYIAYRISSREKEGAVVNVLRYYEAKSALVFVATREGVHDLAERLMSRGFSVVSLSGELSQVNRDRAIHVMKSGHARVLVATDVAARGLDLPDVGLVIHADPPNDPSVLQHRSGRTGRAGQKGTAVILVPAGRERVVERQLQGANITARLLPVPSIKEIEALDAQRFVEDVTGLFADTTDAQKKTAAALLEKYSAEDLVAALVRREQRLLPLLEDLSMTQKLVTRSFSQPNERSNERPTRESRSTHMGDEYSWFQVNVGRTQQADPKWLIPMICRRGNVQKSDIGQINVLLRHTEFEIKRRSAALFEMSAQKPDEKDPKIRFHRSGEAPPPVAPKETKVEVAPPKESPAPKAEAAPVVQPIKAPKAKAAKELIAPAEVESPRVEATPVKVEAEPKKVEAKKEKKPTPQPKQEEKPQEPTKIASAAIPQKKEEAQPSTPQPKKEEKQQATQTEKKPAPSAPPKKEEAQQARPETHKQPKEKKADKPAKPGVKTNPWIEKFKRAAERKSKSGFETPKRKK